MLSRSRILLSLNKNAAKTLESPDESVFLRLVRWRKRRWAKINPSKLFYVREPTPIDPEEWKEMRDGFAKYTRRVRAVRRLFHQMFDAAEVAKTSTAFKEADAREWARRLKINDTWNEETAKNREAHTMAKEQTEEEERLQQLLEIEEKEMVQREEAVRLVLQEQEASKHFVKLENLEEAIEAALNARSMYNFAIDEDGTRFIEQSDGNIMSEEEIKKLRDAEEGNDSAAKDADMA